MSFDKGLNWLFLVPVGFFVGVAAGGLAQVFSRSPVAAIVIAVVVLLGLVIFLLANHLIDRVFFFLFGSAVKRVDKDAVPDDFGKQDGGARHEIAVAAVGFLIGIGATLIWTPSQIMELF